MRITLSTLFVISLIACAASAAQAASTGGAAALALAGVGAPLSPMLPAAEKKTVAAFFAGDTNVNYKKKITVIADQITCRTSNVDITARSCELTFGKKKPALSGRAANELFATQAVAGVAAEGAAGSNIEGNTKLACTLDPAQIKDKSGAGADCTFQTGN